MNLSDTVNIIWQTNNGDETNFEYEYLTKIIFKNFNIDIHFDNKTYSKIINNSIIVYSNNSNAITPEFGEYLDQFDKNSFSFYLLHLSNENLEHNASYYAKAKKVFRSYYDANLENLNVQFIPLGFKSGFYNSNIDDFNSSTNKIYDFCFIGHPKTDRYEMLDTLGQFNTFKHLTNGWNCVTSLSVEDCKHIYIHSKFAPCPMGFSHPDSFRFMESLEWGSIPVLKRYNNFNYHAKIWGDSPIPKVESWSELIKLNSMTNDEYQDLYNTVFTWYKNIRNQISINLNI